MYKLYIHQEIRCDYSIECGTTLIDLESSNMQDAIKESYEILEDYDEDDLGSFEHVMILKIEDIYNIDQYDLLKRIKIQHSIERSKLEEEEERLEFERLKRKFS
jgi:translation elongation factor EF-Tu-like GTPase